VNPLLFKLFNECYILQQSLSNDMAE
jgi:hypothetical protein